jgi:XapX domain-containing protein
VIALLFSMKNIKIVVGLLLGFGIGLFCRYTGVPSPAPAVLPGAILVLAMTSGYLIADAIATHRLNSTKQLCGGPTGRPPSEDKK